MRVASLLRLLSDFSEFVESLGDSSGAHSLRDLQELLVGHEDATVAKFVGDLKKRKPVSRSSESGAIGQTRELLSKLHSLLASAQAKGASSDVAVLAQLLEGNDHPSVKHLVRDAEGWTGKAAKPREARGSEAHTDVISAYVDELRSSEGQNDRFDEVMRRLRSDKGARLADVREIASRYLGFEIAKKKSKQDALKAIADHQAFNARQLARSGGQS